MSIRPIASTKRACAFFGLVPFVLKPSTAEARGPTRIPNDSVGVGCTGQAEALVATPNTSGSCSISARRFQCLSRGDFCGVIFPISQKRLCQGSEHLCVTHFYVRQAYFAHIAQEQQVSDLLQHIERVGDTARPERIPDGVELAGSSPASVLSVLGRIDAAPFVHDGVDCQRFTAEPALSGCAQSGCGETATGQAVFRRPLPIWMA
jgi:hypothetical protein